MDQQVPKALSPGGTRKLEIVVRGFRVEHGHPHEIEENYYNVDKVDMKPDDGDDNQERAGCSGPASALLDHVR